MRAIKVLIVDDEPDFTDILTDRLRSWGFVASSAANGAEAMEALAVSRPDVVILSLRAGHGHELETLSMIKNQDPAIEVLLLTGKGTALAGMQGIERGAFDCLPQPIELGVLIEKIRLAHARHRPELGSNGVGMALLLPVLSAGSGSEWLSSLLVCLQAFSESIILL